MNRNDRQWNNGILVAAVIILAAAPLLFVRNAEFAGADGEARDAITADNPDYQRWLEPMFTPASGEIESLLFAVQAGLGAGVIGYVLGLSRGRREQSQTESPEN